MSFFEKGKKEMRVRAGVKNLEQLLKERRWRKTHATAHSLYKMLTVTFWMLSVL